MHNAYTSIHHHHRKHIRIMWMRSIINFTSDNIKLVWYGEGNQISVIARPPNQHVDSWSNLRKCNCPVTFGRGSFNSIHINPFRCNRHGIFNGNCIWKFKPPAMVFLIGINELWGLREPPLDQGPTGQKIDRRQRNRKNDPLGSNLRWRAIRRWPKFPRSF